MRTDGLAGLGAHEVGRRGDWSAMAIVVAVEAEPVSGRPRGRRAAPGGGASAPSMDGATGAHEESVMTIAQPSRAQRAGGGSGSGGAERGCRGAGLEASPRRWRTEPGGCGVSSRDQRAAPHRLASRLHVRGSFTCSAANARARSAWTPREVDEAASAWRRPWRHGEDVARLEPRPGARRIVEQRGEIGAGPDSGGRGVRRPSSHAAARALEHRARPGGESGRRQRSAGAARSSAVSDVEPSDGPRDLDGGAGGVRASGWGT